jgi:hypothetical protein
MSTGAWTPGAGNGELPVSENGRAIAPWSTWGTLTQRRVWCPHPEPRPPKRAMYLDRASRFKPARPLRNRLIFTFPGLKHRSTGEALHRSFYLNDTVSRGS